MKRAVSAITWWPTDQSRNLSGSKVAGRSDTINGLWQRDLFQFCKWHGNPNWICRSNENRITSYLISMIFLLKFEWKQKFTLPKFKKCGPIIVQTAETLIASGSSWTALLHLFWLQIDRTKRTAADRRKLRWPKDGAAVAEPVLPSLRPCVQLDHHGLKRKDVELDKIYRLMSNYSKKSLPNSRLIDLKWWNFKKNWQMRTRWIADRSIHLRNNHTHGHVINKENVWQSKDIRRNVRMAYVASRAV